jgi:DNA-directed RNA polymerase specialized sigma24 family protein
MSGQDWLAEQFEQHRTRLRAVAYQMLGSLSDAEDAVQETWVRFSRADAGRIESMGAYLTTSVANTCLNMLLRKHAWVLSPLFRSETHRM